MADLTNKYIYETYPSVVGIGDKGSEGVTGTLKPLTDGLGVHMPVEVSLDEVNITADQTTTVQLNIAGYGEVIDSSGTWVGPSAGMTGAQGATGAQGSAGIAGAQGASGISGAQGAIGAQGAKGAQGAAGTAGAKGATGAQGDAGAKGATGAQGTNGTIGAQGAQGATGTAGVKGAQGDAGAKGDTGAQGAIGAQGLAGAQGAEGAQGSVGTNGAQGAQGASGSSNSFFNYQAKTNAQSGDPGSGHILWNNVTQSSATSLNVSELSNGGTNIDLFLNNLAVGSVITIQDQASHLNYQTWTITSKTDNTTYWTYGVTLVTSTHAFSNNDPILLIVVSSPTGAQGAQGVQGAKGDTGAQGSAGTNGTNGAQGSAGTNGTNGAQGAVGAQGSAAPAGLINGVGANSLISAPGLTTTGALAGSANGIAIGNAANAIDDGDICIGNNAVTAASGDGGKIAIGQNALVEHESSVSIGLNAKSHYQAVAIGVGANAGATSNQGGNIAIGRNASADTNSTNIAIGNSSSAQGNHAIAMCESSSASALHSFAIGQLSVANATGAIAFGNGITASTANTVSIKALETQTASTPTAGGIIMKDAGSTLRRLNLTSTGILQIGTGALPRAAQPLISLPPVASVGGATSWKSWVATNGYSRDSVAISDTAAQWSIFSLSQGDTIRALQFYVDTAVAASTCWVGIYRLGTNANGETIATDRLLDCGTVSSATTGLKTITLGTAFTMALETYGAVGIAIGGSTSGINISKWGSGSVIWSGNGGNDLGSSGIFYRANALAVSYSSTTTAPTSLSTGTYTSDTNGALYVFVR